MTSSRIWCAAKFDGIDLEHPDNWIYVLKDTPEVLKAQYTLERCEKEDRKYHYQFCVYLSKKTTAKQAREILKVKYVEPCKGSWHQNLVYCSQYDKDGNPKKTYVAGPFMLSENGEDMEDEPEDDQFQVDPNYKKTVIVCFGGAKIGKTTIWRTIMSYLGGGFYSVPNKAKNSNGRWLGKYEQQENVIIDEFNYKRDFSEDTWKNLLDGTPHYIAMSAGGKSVFFGPKLVVLLTNDLLTIKHPFVDPNNDIFSYRINQVTLWRGAPCPLYTKKAELLYDAVNVTQEDLKPLCEPGIPKPVKRKPKSLVK